MQDFFEELGDDSEVLRQKLDHEASVTNSNILSDSEWTWGRHLLSEAEHELTLLDWEIGELVGVEQPSLSQEERLAHLLARHDNVEAVFANLQISIAPHKRLPAEILAEIFLYSTGGEPIQFPPRCSKPPWIFGRVCSRWRSIVHGESRIWSDVAVECSNSSLGAVKAACTVLPSGGLLSIALMCSEDDLSSNQALDLLIMPHLARIRRLELSLPCSALLRLYETPPEHFSIVESLKLSILSSSTPTADGIERLRNAPIFTSAKRLHQLNLSSIDWKFFDTLLSMCVPWRQVTDLELGAANPLPLLVAQRILRQCSHLVRFSADIERASRNSVSNGNYRLLHLQRLTLTLQDSRFFKYLFVPALTELWLSGDAPFPNTDLAAMIVRSRCDLLVFEYNGEYKPTRYNVDALHDFFETVPCLLYLSAFFLVLRQCTLERIASGELLPCLETVQIRLDSPIAFVSLVEARFRGSFQSGFVGGFLREARGYYVQQRHVHGSEMDAAVARLEVLNDEYGTQFTLTED